MTLMQAFCIVVTAGIVGLYIGAAWEMFGGK